MFYCNDRGMTLVDFIITITILGILLSVAIPNFIRAIHRSEDITKKMNSKLLLSIIQTYNSEQIDRNDRLINTTITSMDDISIGAIRKRIPSHFDWNMLYPIYIDDNGKGSIQYE